MNSFFELKQHGFLNAVFAAFQAHCTRQEEVIADYCCSNNIIMCLFFIDYDLDLTGCSKCFKGEQKTIFSVCIIITVLFLSVWEIKKI